MNQAHFFLDDQSFRAVLQIRFLERVDWLGRWARPGR
jgi:hypothetical protein